DRGRWRQRIKLGEALRCRERGPFGWPHPGNAAALLIDKDREIRSAREIPEGVGELKQLVGIAAVPLEQDEAGRLGLQEELPFVPGQLEAFKAVDRRLHRVQVLTEPRSNSRRRL